MKLFQLRALLPLLGGLFLFSCKPFTKIEKPDPSLDDPVTVKQVKEDSYSLRFPYPAERQFFVGTESDRIDWNRVVGESREGEVVIRGLEEGRRYFFGVKEEGQEPFVVGERRVPVESIVNFRDLGGIPAKDGRLTQWGKLYRSGKLAHLTKKDMKYFANLGIKTIVDFRNDKEVKKDPNKYPKNSTINYVRVVIGDEEGNVQEALKKQVLENRSNPDFDSRAFVVDVNRTFVDSFAYQYIPLIELLMDEANYPLLFHCTAGKDRTGLAAAIILGAIGVDKEVIMNDFMMSNYYRNERNNKVLRKMTLIGVRQEVAQPLLEVDESYLQAAFQQMDANHGSMDTFLAKELGLGDQERSVLQEHLLLPVESALYWNDNKPRISKPGIPD